MRLGGKTHNTAISTVLSVTAHASRWSCVVSGQEDAHVGQDPVSAVHTKVKVLMPGPVTLHCPGVAVAMVAVTVRVAPE